MTADEPWVWLPGMICSARLWSGVAPLGSITPLLEETSVDAEVERLLDELPARFGLVGLSLGAIVAMALVARAPERVSALALLSTNPYGPTDAQRSGWRDLRDQLAAGRSARDLQTDLLPVLLSPPAQADPGLAEATLAMADDVGEARLDRQLQLQASRVDLRPALAAVGCPTLIVAAEDDALCSVARLEELHGLISGSRLVVVERCGHLSPLERPQQTASLVAPLRSVSRGRGG